MQLFAPVSALSYLSYFVALTIHANANVSNQKISFPRLITRPVAIIMKGKLKLISTTTLLYPMLPVIYLTTMPALGIRFRRMVYTRLLPSRE